MLDKDALQQSLFESHHSTLKCAVHRTAQMLAALGNVGTGSITVERDRILFQCAKAIIIIIIIIMKMYIVQKYTGKMKNEK